MSSSYDDDMDLEDMEMDEGEGGGIALTNIPPATDAPAPPASNDPAAQKRRAIQEILRDTKLSDLDKRLRIQALMDGRPVQQQQSQTRSGEDQQAGSANFTAVDSGRQVGVGGSTSNAAVTYPEAVTSCIHYQRNCMLVAPCCNQVFGCRICHDEMTSASSNPGAATAGGASQTDHGPMDRFAVRELVCKQCYTRQNVKTYVFCFRKVIKVCLIFLSNFLNLCLFIYRNNCIKCGIQFGEYHCIICNLFMASSKQPFHCEKCGFCRVGGRENFHHCDSCCMCISNTVYAVHNCMRDKYKNDCPVCREDMFSSRQAPQDLPCGHAIHSHCFRKLASFDYRCPICKKTVVCKNSMEMAWAARARDIELQPMPADLRRIVNIMCNDCETKSLNREWHFLGVQCPECRSFNTIVEQVVCGGDEAPTNPPTGAGAS